jgi:hypothetical protein
MIPIVQQLNECRTLFEAFPQIQLVDYRSAPALSGEQLTSWERDCRHALPDDLKKLYLQTDGFCLEWQWREEGQPLKGKISLRPLSDLYPFQKDGNWYVEPELEGFEERLLVPLDRAKGLSCSKGEDQRLLSGFADLLSYYAFLLAGRGLLSWRKEALNNKNWPETTAGYWEDPRRHLDLAILRLRESFPECELPGTPYPQIDHLLMRQKAQQSSPLIGKELRDISRRHLQFLETGGAGGRWKTFHVQGLVVGLYEGAEGEQGQQASLEFQKVDKALSFTRLELPFSNFCGFYGPSVSFSGAHLAYTLFTDSFLEKAQFDGSDLRQTDFSRSDLRGASFHAAEIRGADFENCLLQGADFSNCNTELACFRGARLM